MKWLAAIVEGLTKGFLGWGQSQAEKPRTMEDANTPKDIRDKLNRSVDDFMRDKDGRDGGHVKGLDSTLTPYDGTR